MRHIKAFYLIPSLIARHEFSISTDDMTPHCFLNLTSLSTILLFFLAQ